MIIFRSRDKKCDREMSANEYLQNGEFAYTIGYKNIDNRGRS